MFRSYRTPMSGDPPSRSLGSGASIMLAAIILVVVCGRLQGQGQLLTVDRYQWRDGGAPYSEAARAVHRLAHRLGDADQG